MPEPARPGPRSPAAPIWSGLRVGLVLGSLAFAALRMGYPRLLVEEPLGGLWLLPLPALAGASLALLLRLVRVPSPGGASSFLLLFALLLPTLLLLWPGRPSLLGAALVSLLAAALLGWLLGRWDRRLRHPTAGALLVTAMASAAGAAAGAGPAGPSDGRDRVIVLGLDAATWNLIDELFALGDLPHLRRLVDEGSSGILRSAEPTFSPTVWTTIASGKGPERHGILDFHSTQNEHLRVARMWEILAAHGRSVGIYRWLVTWPPEPWGDVVVPGWMARGPETRPPELRFLKELEIAFQTLANEDKGRVELAETFVDWGRQYLAHGLRLSSILEIGRLVVSDALLDGRWQKREGSLKICQLLLQGDVLLELYRRQRPEFLGAVFYGTDTLAHTFWKYRYPEVFGLDVERTRDFRELLTDYYRAADRFLGELLARTDGRTTVIVVSDHGFGHLDQRTGTVQENRQLKPRMQKLAALMGVSEEATVSNVVAGYLTPRSSDPAATGELLARAEAWLAAVTTGGQPVFRLARSGNSQLEIGIERASYHAADQPIETPAGPMAYKDLVAVEEQAGSHSLDGVLLARGPGIRKGHRVEGASILDVAPTVLYLLGVPVGEDMEGKVLSGMLQPALLDSRPVETAPSYDAAILDVRRGFRSGAGQGNADAFTRQLEKLGYLK